MKRNYKITKLCSQKEKSERKVRLTKGNIMAKTGRLKNHGNGTFKMKCGLGQVYSVLNLLLPLRFIISGIFQHKCPQSNFILSKLVKPVVKTVHK